MRIRKNLMGYYWWSYWRRIGHIPKKRADCQLSIDSSSLYDNRDFPLPLNTQEEIFAHGYFIQLYSDRATIFPSSGDPNVGYIIPVVTTQCNYGGVRHWFLCPEPKCNCRCKKLYLDHQGIFLCRKCLKLAYVSQNLSEPNRLIRKKWALIHKLGADSDYIIEKPKGMHRKTFDSIRAEIEKLGDSATESFLLNLL